MSKRGCRKSISHGAIWKQVVKCVTKGGRQFGYKTRACSRGLVSVSLLTAFNSSIIGWSATWNRGFVHALSKRPLSIVVWIPFPWRTGSHRWSWIWLKDNRAWKWSNLRRRTIKERIQYLPEVLRANPSSINRPSSTWWIMTTSVHNATDTVDETRSSHSSINELAKLGSIIPTSFVVWLYTLHPIKLPRDPLQFLVFRACANYFWILAEV